MNRANAGQPLKPAKLRPAFSAFQPIATMASSTRDRYVVRLWQLLTPTQKSVTEPRFRAALIRNQSPFFSKATAYNMFRFIILLLTLLTATTAHADTRIACTLVQKLGHSEPVFRQGYECSREFAPASTFKLALALIGFDSGILETSEAPARPYDPATNAAFDSWKQTITPRLWLRFSVIWYSQWITTALGMQTFQDYVDRFNYGNRDLRGAPGRNNGLTHAWLGTSLKISPIEQLAFLERLVAGRLPVSGAAIDKTKDTVQVFVSSTGLNISGKTGTTWATDEHGNRLREQHGWFVGWFTRGDDTYVFVHLIVEESPEWGFASSRAKATVLSRLDQWLPAE